jgi:hypothetical protein
MKYRLHVANRDTGVEQVVEIDRATEIEARKAATEAGYLIAGTTLDAKQLLSGSAPLMPPPEFNEQHKIHRGTPLGNSARLTCVLAVGVTAVWLLLVLPVQCVRHALRSDIEIEADRIADEQHLSHEQAIAAAERRKAETEANGWKTKPDKTMAYLMMESFVEKRLRAPGTAKFSQSATTDEASEVQYIGEGRYRIDSFVDSQNGFGALLRSTFSGEIKQVDKDHWHLVSLEVREW